MVIIQSNEKNDLILGRQGENLARQVVFDLSAWVAEYGPGTAELIYQRPGDTAPYPAAAVREGNTLLWTLTATDTAVASSFGKDGHCELRYYVGETLAKSKTWRTWVDPAMGTPTGEVPPEPEQGWFEQVLAVGAAAKSSADAAKVDADRTAALASEVSENAAKTMQDASNAKEAAQTAQRLAEAARDASRASQKGAEMAQEKAETAAIRQPYPNAETGTWWTWGVGTAAYADSGEPYEGTALYATFDIDPTTGKLYVYTPARYYGPTFALNETTGKLEVTVNG